LGFKSGSVEVCVRSKSDLRANATTAVNERLAWRYVPKKFDVMKSVPAEKLAHIVECGWHRPSGLQPFELFVVSNADIGRPKMIRLVNLKKVRRSRENFVTEVK